MISRDQAGNFADEQDQRNRKKAGCLGTSGGMAALGGV
jgi:hypothetical protein